MEKTYLLDCRIVDPASGGIWEDGLCSLHHGDAAPDPIGYCGSRTDGAAPDYTVLNPGDNPLSLEGATLLPSLIDVSATLATSAGVPIPEMTLTAYRRAAAMLRHGITSVGATEDPFSIVQSLAKSGSDYTLWLPMLLPSDESACRPGYCLFRGLPKKGSQEEAVWLNQANKANILGMKPVLATESAPVLQADGKLTLVCMAELLVKGGFTPMEAIKALTVNAAEVLGIDYRTGKLQGGYEADIFAVQGNPLTDISALHNCVMHARGGRLTWSGLKGFPKTNFAILPPGYDL